MRLRGYLNSEFVVLRLESSDVEGVVGEVARQAAAAGLGDAEVIGAKLLERERQHPTVMGSGLAIPHATVPGLEAPVIGVALAPDPISFGEAEADPVRAFFIVLSPPGHERSHVKLLARICRLVRQHEFLERLQEARDGAEVLAVIEQVDDRRA